MEEKNAANETNGVDYAVHMHVIKKSDEKFDRFVSNFCNANFRPVLERTSTGSVKRFNLDGKPLAIMGYLYVVAKEIGQVDVSDTKWKMSIPCSKDQDKEADTFKMQIELHEVELNKKYTVSVSRKGGSERTFK
jgi:hypothetical protein